VADARAFVVEGDVALDCRSMSVPQRLATLALCALLLVPSLARAGGSSPGARWAILLASAPQWEEAEARLRAMHAARAFAFVKPAEGFPRVLESASLPGLQPGLYVVVLGVCGVHGEALDAQARVRPGVGDAYLKKLTGPVAPSCPQPVNRDSKLPRGAEQLASVPFEGVPGLALTAHQGNVRSMMECTTSTLIVRLVLGRKVLAETTFEGRCQGACTRAEKEEGKKTLEELREAIEKGETDDSQLDYDYTSCQSFEASFERALGGFGNPVFIVSSSEPGPHSAVRTVLRIVGVGCGGLRMSEPFVGADAVFYVGRWEAVPELAVRPAPAKSPGGKRFSLLKPEAADAGSGEWFADVEWVEARCAWEVDDRQ
jgi:hypothetical protein